MKHVAKRRKAVNPRTFYGKAQIIGRNLPKLIGVGKKLYRGYNKAKQIYNSARKSSASSRSASVRTTQLQGISQHNDWTSRPSKVIVVGRKHAQVKTVSAFKLVHHLSKTLGNVQGRQAVSVGMEIFTKDQLGGVTTNVLGSTSQWDTDPFLLNPYSTAPQNSIYPNTPNEVVATDKLFIKNVKSHLRIVSMESIPQRVKVYWILNKRNTNLSATTIWSTSIANNAGYLQTGSVAPSTLATSTFTSGYAHNYDIGQTPFGCPDFRKFFKLLDKDQFILQPGDEITVSRTFIMNKMYYKNTILTMSTEDRYVPGYTITPVIVVDGSLVGIASNLGTEAGRVAPGATKVGVFSSDHITFAATPASRFNIVRNEPAYTAGDTTDTLKHLNDTDDVIVETSV